MILSRKIIISIFVLASVAVSLQSYFRNGKVYEEGGRRYNCYNNYTVYKQSHVHLLAGKDLYCLYPEEHWDLYKYSPTFAAGFGIFSWMPDLPGLILWNLLNALILALAVYYLPIPDTRTKSLILLACLIELITSMQNEQSNGLVAGLIILAFGMMERDKIVIAALCIVCSAYIKIFGVVGFALFLFYPRVWKAALWSLLWAVILFALPIAVTGPARLAGLYANWGQLLVNDHNASYGLSVMGLLHAWTGAEVSKNFVVLAGIILFLVPLARFRDFRDPVYRMLALCSILIWSVIFNHKAESPTFIIAMAGVSIWFFTSRKSWFDISLFVLAFLFTSLSPTDFIPFYLKAHFFLPLKLKVLPCIIVWGVIFYRMLTVKAPVSETTEIPQT